MIKRPKRQKGFTLTEVIVSSAIFTIIIGMVLNFYLRAQGNVRLTQSEARMQSYSRMAMTNISKELRQASDYHEVTFTGVPQAKEILFVRPEDNQSDGNIAQYILVRYWYQENSQGVYSLLRAQKSHGTDAKFIPGDESFKPDSTNSVDIHDYKIRSLVKEATVIEPGKQSFFLQDSTNPGVIQVRLVTATYGYKKEHDATGKNLEVHRRFRVDTSVNARNLL